ncbi:MAG: HAMP domain-containing histidine kinase [Candidatus Omnitrophica bacterium]|nr:HAMP domain-containing histidine kinase [Candidatus Omnitrophota bacterium]
MLIPSQIIFDIAHKTTKPLGALVTSLEMFDTYPDKVGLNSAEDRKRMARIAQAVIGTIMDLRHLAMCDEKEKVGAKQPFNWRLLIHHNLPGSSHWGLAKSLTWDGKDEDYDGSGYVALLERAVRNLAWFNRQFWSEPAKVKLSLVEKEGCSWVDCVWDFGDSISVDPKFSSFDPFFSMNPKNSSIADSTGLALYATKKTIELHGGTITAETSKGLVIHLSCPKELADLKADIKVDE